MALIILTFLFVLLVLLYKWSVLTYQTFKERGVPHATPRPLLGNVSLNVLLGRSAFAKMLIEQHLQFCNSKIYGIYNMRDPVFMLRDPELIKRVGIRDFDHFSNHRTVISESDESLLSKSLIALKDRKWKEMRNTLTPTFTGSKMRAMFKLINECSVEGVQFVAAEAKNSGSDAIELEMKEFFTRFANDVIASAAFGIQVNSFRDKHNEFYTIGQSITQLKGMALFKAILFGLMPRLMKFLRVKLFNQKKIKYFYSLVFDAMKYRQQNNIIRPDMIHLLMEAKQQFEQQKQQQQQQEQQKHQSNSAPVEHAEFNNEDLLAQCLLFFFAGFETVSTCLCFLTYELCMNPVVQAELYAEIRAVEQQLKDNPLSYDTLNGMKYMDMVISESLRKWPPAIATDRLCGADIDLTDENGVCVVSLKKNDLLFVPILALHHDPDNFAEPDKFRPERFSEHQKSDIKPFTYLPFGVGPRNCIGNRLALMEVKSIIYHLVLNFSLVPAEKTVKDMMQSIVGFRMQPKENFWVKYVPRAKTA